MAARIFDIFPLLLITLVCVGVVEGGYQALEYYLERPFERQNVTVDPAISSPVQKSGGQKKEALPIQNNYSIILKRNLFGSLPKKAVEEVKDESAYAKDLELTSLNIVLQGTVKGNEGDTRAIILDKSSNQQELYEKGDVIQSALVKNILRGKVILTFNGKDEMLDMSEAANTRAKMSGQAAKQSIRPPLKNIKGPVAVAPVMNNRTIPGSTPGLESGKPRKRIVRPRIIRPSRQVPKVQ